MLTVVALVLILGLLVFVHELGHFVAAKLSGVEVKTFAFGFPPRIWSKKIGETTYAVNALPFGGYVTLRGENEEIGEKEVTEKEEENPRSLLSKTPLQLLFIFVSGVAMNIVLAFVLLYAAFLIGFQPIYSGMWNHEGVTNTMQVTITDVESGSPAETNGIQAGDIITKVDGENVYLDNDVVSTIREKNTDEGATANLTIVRNGVEIEKTISTYKATVTGSNGEESQVSRIGVVLDNTGQMKGNFFSSFVAAADELWYMVKATFVGVVNLFGQLVTKFTVSDDVTGPVGIYVATNYFAQMGIMYLVQFAAILSISLAVFNILPIPGLDGGHATIVIIEAITKRKLSVKTKGIIQMVGFSALILLMVVVTIKDVVNFDIIGYIKGVF